MFDGSMGGDAGAASSVAEPLDEVAADPANELRCFCDRASNGQLAYEEADRKVSVAGCRIGGMPFVVG
jgi:hypothetical protein